MAIKREFNKGDTAYLANNKRGDGFMLKMDTPVEITDYDKIYDKAGGYIYSFYATNPRTGERIHHNEWLTQFDFMSKKQADKLHEQKAEIERLKKLAKEKGIEV